MAAVGAVRHLCSFSRTAPSKGRNEKPQHRKKNARPTKRRQRRCPTADRDTEVSTSLWPVARPQRPAATAFVWATPYCFFLCVFFFEDRSRWVGRVPDGDEDSPSRRRRRGPKMSGRRSTVTRYGGRCSTLRSRGTDGRTKPIVPTITKRI